MSTPKSTGKAILGISAYYHDSAAALLVDGKIVAAAQEERFSRKKHDARFPIHAAKYVLQEGGISFDELTAVAFYDKPYLKFERLLETYHAFTPKGLESFLSAIPVWIKEKLFMKKMLRDACKELGQAKVPFLFPEHHLSHAASAFYPSPFEEAAILTLDGVGEWATTTIGKGAGKEITLLEELSFPHSLGLLYSAFTYYAGFRVNSGEYKLMGLAPYGDPDSRETIAFKEKIYETLIDAKPDGSLLLNMDYFRFATGLRMCHDANWTRLFGIPPREPESELTQSYMNMALAIQQVTEERVLALARTARSLTGCKHLVMAGGVALNCVANGKLAAANIFEDIWIQPAAGDAGGALGAAQAAWHIWQGEARTARTGKDDMQGSYLGPDFSDRHIQHVAEKFQAPYTLHASTAEMTKGIATVLDAGKVVGWFQGRMEFGPRALGARSILGDPRKAEMQKKMNLKIKYRESFRPFAPSVRAEKASEYFDMAGPSPYMLMVYPVRESRRKQVPGGYHQLSLREKLYHERSDIPAITHIDFSARIQTVSQSDHAVYWELLNAFETLTGCSLLVNTSFNVRGEPIVCTPEDAYRCFMRTEMDYLVMGNFVFKKQDQPQWEPTSVDASPFHLD